MVNVFICEDDFDYRSRIKKCVENYISMENLAMPIVCDTGNPTDILEYIKQNEKKSGLYFLDLDLGCDITGIQLAEKIRRYDPFGCIVFITADGNAYKLTFEHSLEAMGYIVKGDFDLGERICRCILNAHAKLMASSPATNDKFVFKLAKDIKSSSIFAKNSTLLVFNKICERGQV